MDHRAIRRQPIIAQIARGKGAMLVDYPGLGRRVKTKRKAMLMTQAQLAERTGISISFLGHIERGTRKASLETLIGLANALELSTDFLLQDSLNLAVDIQAQPSIESEVLNEFFTILDNYNYLKKKESSTTIRDEDEEDS